jgi:hypothetical protein
MDSVAGGYDDGAPFRDSTPELRISPLLYCKIIPELPSRSCQRSQPCTRMRPRSSETTWHERELHLRALVLARNQPSTGLTSRVQLSHFKSRFAPGVGTTYPIPRLSVPTSAMYLLQHSSPRASCPICSGRAAWPCFRPKPREYFLAVSVLFTCGHRYGNSAIANCVESL